MAPRFDGLDEWQQQIAPYEMHSAQWPVSMRGIGPNFAGLAKALKGPAGWLRFDVSTGRLLVRVERNAGR
ncbi:hypothetical protein, partial [Mesorhizobium sp. M4A.F.Ca.ET.020.02.1.1]|uniref:hypothetical protein n=1 Tax=Mesorhizobium sp. M4A.F.Ca.ET.020.02.1.1 TaxID=2496652 RepID=UPI001AEC97D7